MERYLKRFCEYFSKVYSMERYLKRFKNTSPRCIESSTAPSNQVNHNTLRLDNILKRKWSMNSKLKRATNLKISFAVKVGCSDVTLALRVRGHHQQEVARELFFRGYFHHVTHLDVLCTHILLNETEHHECMFLNSIITYDIFDQSILFHFNLITTYWADLIPL